MLRGIAFDKRLRPGLPVTEENPYGIALAHAGTLRTNQGKVIT